MSFDNLIKAMGVFSQGMTQLNVARATNEAQEQLNALNAQELDQKARLEAQSQIGNNLALRLQRAGASAADISATAGRLSVSGGEEAQLQNAQTQQEMTQKFKHDENEQLHKHQLELKRMDMEIAGRKVGAKLTEHEMGFIDKTQKAFETAARKPLEALNNIQLAKNALTSNNPIADKSIVNFLARASGEVGALTEADKAPFGGSTALVAKMKQAAANAATGRFTPENKKLVSQLIATYEKTHRQNVAGIRDRISKRAANTAKVGGYDLDQNKISTMIYSDSVEEAPQAAAPAPPAAPQGAAQAPVNPLNKYLTPVGN